MTIAQRVEQVRREIARAAEGAGRDVSEITLCAATKTQSDDDIRTAIAAGVPVCGENRVQELTAHLEADAYAGARVHFIGHLQTNKVNKVVGRVELIHSVDSLRLLGAVDAQAKRLGIRQDILLEVNIAGEGSKGGLSPDEVADVAAQAATLAGVRLRGLMTIPPLATRPGENIPYFQAMEKLFVDMRAKITDNQTNIDCLSMGMSGDFTDAIACGATLVRVGTALFGPRAAPPR